MSKTSFEKALHVRSSPIDELEEPELYEHISVNYISEINKQRRSSSMPVLFFDDNCAEAAKNSFQSIGNLHSLLKTHEVVGSDFSHIFHEHSASMTPSLSQNKSILEGFIQSFASMDSSNKAKFLDPNFNSVGLSVKRSFGSFKVMAILFKKALMINHLEYDINSGFKLAGKMLDSYNCIFIIAIKDSKDSVKPTIAGPKRISVKQDYKDFEVVIPRMIMSSRSAGEKIVEFYTIKAEPRSIGYSIGQDLTSISPDASLAHSVAFNGLWESNLMFETRSLTESQVIKETYEKVAGSKIMIQTTHDFKGKTVGRGRASNIPTTTRNEWGSRGTPWKSTVTGALSTIPESSRETDMKTDNWSCANKENYGFVNEIGMATRGESNFNRNEGNFNRGEGYGGNFAYPSASNPFATGSGTMSNPFSGVANPFASGNSNNMGFSSGYSVQMTASSPQGYPSILPNSGSAGMAGQYHSAPGNQGGVYGGHGNPYSQAQNYPYSQQGGFVNPMNLGSHVNPMNNVNAINNMSSMNVMQGNPGYGQQIPYMPGQNYYPSPQVSQVNYNNSGLQRHAVSHFTHPAFVDLQSPATLVSCSEVNPINMSGITSFPFAVKTSMNPLNTFTSTSSFYPLKNDEDKKRKKQEKKSKKLSKNSKDSNSRPEGQNLKSDEVYLPGFQVPVPPSIVQQIRRLKPENESYAKLFESMEYSDIVLHVKDTDLKAHKAVLYSSSRSLRDQLDKARTSSISSKLVLPTWIQAEPFKLVLKFMYTSSLQKETISLKLAQEMLIIADYLCMLPLCDVLIIQYILPQLSQEDSLTLIKLAVTRDKEASEGWDYLVTCCLSYIGQNSNTIVRNFRSECLNLPVPCVLRIVNASMKYLTSLDHASLVIKLLTDIQYAHCVFELTQKVTNLFLFGYNNHFIDIHRLDYTRPLTKDQLGKLDPKIIMEYPLIDETAPFFLTTSRATTIPAKKLSDSVNQATFSNKPLIIVPNKELRARGSCSFSFSVSDFHRPKNVMSQCFQSNTRMWSLLVQTSKDGTVSLFLCERGQVESANQFVPLLFTSVLFEVEIEDEGVFEHFRSNSRPEYLAGFYSFANNQNHMAGERNFCKVSSVRNLDLVKITVYIREVSIHSGLLHYLCENFDSLSSNKVDKFLEIDMYNMKYLLASDLLNVSNEREAAGAFWKYTANQSIDCVDLLINEIRLGFLSTKDLLTMARDHQGFRNSPIFRYLFEAEYRRRTENKKNLQKPRKKYEGTVEKGTDDYVKEMIDWILEDNHHAGYIERIAKLKKELEESKKEILKFKSESVNKKFEQDHTKVRQIVGGDRMGGENWGPAEFRPVNEYAGRLEAESRYREQDFCFVQDKKSECLIV